MPKGNYVRSEESRENMSKAQKALFASGYVNPFQGRKHSEETRKKMRENHKGTTGLKLPKRIAWNKGKEMPPLSPEHKKKLSDALKKSAKRGSEHPFWGGDEVDENKRIRNSIEYKEWRKLIWERDGYTCLFRQQVGGRLVADHIKPFALYPELRFNPENGRTLCWECHKTTDTFGWRTANEVRKKRNAEVS